MQPTQSPAREPDAHPATPVALTPATYLRGAGLYLVRHGWRQGDMFGCLSDDDQREGLDPAEKPTPFPKACALGAVRMAVFGTAEFTADTAASSAFDQTVGVFAGYLVDFYGVADPSDAITSRSRIGLEEIVSGWNDDPDRIAAHVIAALYAAAVGWNRVHRKAEPADPVCCSLPMTHRSYPAAGGPLSAEVYFCATCQEWAYAEDVDWCPAPACGGVR